MKIEKLTKDKIRVIVNSDEIDLSSVNLHSIMTKAVETQGFFFNILQKAEKEVNFHTEGCKLLIEAFASLDDILVFTITKYSVDDIKKYVEETKTKKPIIKRKSFDPISQNIICKFENFEVFCDFCCFAKNLHNLDAENLAKSTKLYQLHNSYYLVLKNVNPQHEKLKLFVSTLSEFGKLTTFSNSFECKLLEHGKVIIKKNALEIGMKFLVD